tara:strand:+ start:501 stop:2198 length:1698 start_codon:yes stop_codon:yes gene_type:complete
MLTKLFSPIEKQKPSNIKFHLPIEYNDKMREISNIVLDDCEINDNNSIYKHIFNNNKLNWNKYYTTDTKFLSQMQYLITNFNNKTNIENNLIDDVENILDELNNETGFYEKYNYIDIEFLKEINYSAIALQWLSLYQLTSPFLTLIIPIIMLIIPFILLKFQRVNITLTTYTNVLINLFKHHVLGQLITQFNNVSWDRRVFIIMSIGFYFVNIYQNIITCYKFYTNIYKIRTSLLKVKKFIELSLDNMDNVNSLCKDKLILFVNKNNTIKNTLLHFKNDIDLINAEKISIFQLTKIGNLFKSFYELFSNNDYKASLDYIIDLQIFTDNISNLATHIKNNRISLCKFTKKSTNFTNAYYAPLINNTSISNSYKIDKNIIITGPNAAGKTTLLKTTLFNIILSQQIGMGCYSKANIFPYDIFHSYINIPDTSERDSLFQAEARRCKDILNSIENNSSKLRHFCIFDELYSGTNPNEAIASATSFLTYISEIKNINYLLTTHYVSLCKLLKDNSNIENNYMDTIDNKPTYKLKNGISQVKGGIKVLQELNYNKNIINNAEKILNNIDI